MAIDIFANNASATVSSGGTTAPAAGTSESWTLSSIVGLAAATGVTQMRLIDPAASSEIMLLTNLSGTAATVTRGVEGTTPVAHAANFTVNAVVTASAAASFDYRRAGLLHPSDLGYLGWTADPQFTSGRASFTNQIQGGVIFMDKDATVTKMTAQIGAGGSGFTAAGYAIYDDTATLIGKTSDLSTPFASSGTVTASLQSSVAVKAGHLYLVCVGQNATAMAQFEQCGSLAGDGALDQVTIGGANFYRHGWRDTSDALSSGPTWPSKLSGGGLANPFWIAVS